MAARKRGHRSCRQDDGQQVAPPHSEPPRPHLPRSARGPAALSRQGMAERTDTPRRRTIPPGRGVRTIASVPCGSVVHLEPWRSSAAAQTRPRHRLGIGCVFRSSSLPWHSLTGGSRADSSHRPADRLRRAHWSSRWRADVLACRVVCAGTRAESLMERVTRERAQSTLRLLRYAACSDSSR